MTTRSMKCNIMCMLFRVCIIAICQPDVLPYKCTTIFKVKNSTDSKSEFSRTLSTLSTKSGETHSVVYRFPFMRSGHFMVKVADGPQPWRVVRFER
jgi:hypothetical protein